MWSSTYGTPEFMVDDQTGEIYAMKGDEPQLKKEYGVLNEEEARNQYLKNLPLQPWEPVLLSKRMIGSETGAIPKVTPGSEASKDEELRIARQEYKEEQKKRYQASLQAYKERQNERKSKEQELLKMDTEGGKIPTKAEIEKTRTLIEKEYQKYLDLEKEALKKYYDNYPS